MQVTSSLHNCFGNGSLIVTLVANSELKFKYEKIMLCFAYIDRFFSHYGMLHFAKHDLNRTFCV